MQKRGAPVHIQKPVFIHPEANSSFITIVEKVPDPRRASPNFCCSLTSILYMVTITTLSGAKEWEEMALMTEHIQEWISQYVDVSSGTPSAYTLERVISLVEPIHLESMLREIAQLFCKTLNIDIIDIDGKIS